MPESDLARHRRLLRERESLEAKALLQERGFSARLLDQLFSAPAAVSLPRRVQQLHDAHDVNFHTAVAGIDCRCYPSRLADGSRADDSDEYPDVTLTG